MAGALMGFQFRHRSNDRVVLGHTNDGLGHERRLLSIRGLQGVHVVLIEFDMRDVINSIP